MPVITHKTKLTHVVTAIVWNGDRDWISVPMTKKDAEQFAKIKELEMRKSIPKYKWATKIKVEKVDI